MSTFQDKTVLVTGASQGLGKAIASGFAAEGARVIVTSENEEGLAQAVAEIGKLGKTEVGKVVFDISVPDEVEQAVSRIEEKFGRVNILINNVGVGVAKNFRETTLVDFDKVVKTNLRGPFFFTQGIVKNMKEGDSIIFVTSIHADRPSLDPTYDGTKAAINNWTKNLALELASSGIRVNAIAPGHVDKETSGEPREQKDVPLTGRAGLPVDVSNACLFLSDPKKARYITGQILEVGGGLSLWESSLSERL